ncbi:MAG: hypothetical protein II652_06585 [Bacteroidales bacterium]|nr:hypothetical protein [Bacteroidales bacterium]MBQ4299175.1 hypothetical protein [Bacteroidales bacterium]
MEQLPLTFVQSTVEPEIQECFTPAFNFTRINSSSGRLAFTANKLYWLPDNPMAMMDQGWVANISEIDSCSKSGIAGFIIKLKDGKELRFSNVFGNMREGITAAIEERQANPVAEEPAAEPAAEAAEAAEAAPEAAPAEEAPAAEAAPVADIDDASSNKVMAILAYFGILVLIPLFAAKESKFARFHVNQGLILLICSVVTFVIGKIPGLGFLVWILDIAILVYAIIGIVNAAKGQAKELPYIGKFKIIQ